MTQAGVVKYPKIQALHYVENLFPDDHIVYVEEKLDGSNVAIYKRLDGIIQLQSRETVIDPEKPGMFKPFVEWVLQHDVGRYVHPGEIWYGEMVSNQGKIKYEKKQPFVLFDRGFVTEDGVSFFTSIWDWNVPAFVDFVKNLKFGYWSEVRSRLSDLFDSLPALSEGLVIKAHNVTIRWTDAEEGTSGSKFLPLLGGKIVREDFQEMKAGKTNLKGADDPLAAIADKYVTPARVRKAVARIAERGDDPYKGHLVIQDVLRDIHDEEENGIKNDLFAAYWKKISNAAPKLVLAEHAKHMAGQQRDESAIAA